MRHEIPFFFMRGGTSRGPYFDAANLPENRDDITKILLKVIGAGHQLNIDGIGGGNQVTNKVQFCPGPTTKRRMLIIFSRRSPWWINWWTSSRHAATFCQG